MKNTEILLRALNDVNDEFIPRDLIHEADKKASDIWKEYSGDDEYAEMQIVTPKKSAKRKWGVWGGGCAAVLAGAIALGGVHWALVTENARYENVLENYRIYPEYGWETKTEELPLISSTYKSGGFYGTSTVNDLSELEEENKHTWGTDIGNPWTEDSFIETMPVFGNLCYSYEGTRMGNSAPFYYTEEELKEMSDKIVYLLNLTVKNSNFSYDTSDDKPYCIHLTCESDKYKGYVGLVFIDPKPENQLDLYVYGDGRISINIADADKYPKSEFKDLLQYRDPVYKEDIESGGFYVRERSENIAEEISSCFFSYAYVSEMGIDIVNLFPASEYIGDYPVITPQQAVEQLHSGGFITNVPEQCIIGDAEVYKIGLVYESSNMDKYRQPYYLIAAETDYSSYDITEEDGISYGYFFVPAISPEYRTTEEELNEGKTVLPVLEWETAEGDPDDLLLSAPDVSFDFLGGAGIIYAEDTEEIDKFNPWNEEASQSIDTMPVFRDLSYNEEWSFYCLTEEQMREAAEWAAHELLYDAKVTDTVYDYHSALDGGITNLTAVLKLGGYGVSNGVLRIYTNGKTELLFGDKAKEAAEEVGLTVNSTNFTLDEYFEDHNFPLSAERSATEEAKTAVDYIMEAFGVVFDYENPAAAPYPVCYDTEVGAQWRYKVYDSSEDLVRSIVNYSLNYAVLEPTENRRDQLVSIEAYNRLAVSEYAGDYRIITAEDAKQRLAEGEGFCGVMSEGQRSRCLIDRVVKTQLVYLREIKGGTTMYVPYYRMLVATENSGEYGVFFVRAVAAD